MNVDFVLAGTVILSGVGIVFLVLIILTLIMYAFGKVMGGVGGGKKQEGPAPVPAKKEAPPPAAKVMPAAPAKAPAVEDGISDEIVAVISASVAAVMGGEPFVLRSVRRAAVNKAGRGAWSMAGLAQNTSPF